MGEVLVSPVLPLAGHSGLVSPDDPLYLAVICSAIVSAACLSFPVPLAKEFSYPLTILSPNDCVNTLKTERGYPNVNIAKVAKCREKLSKGGKQNKRKRR